MRAKLANTFRSLGGHNYRLWAVGALVSNVGTWMQRTAQDWIVLTELTHNNATSVGIVMALQFGPQVFMLPFTGLAADMFDRRRILLATQTAMGLLALGLGLLTITGLVQLWHVYIFALLLGIVAAFDGPARQTFVSELVNEANLPNAVALNSASFNAARMIGPAVAGVMIAGIGSGWVYIINAISNGAVLVSLAFLNLGQLNTRKRVSGSPEGLIEGFRYVCRRPDLRALLAMLFIIGTFGLNFPIYISTMSVTVFRAGAGEYGILSSVMAVGSVVGALMAAGRDKPRFGLLVLATAIFGVGCGLAGLAPNYWLFGALLVFIGVAAQTFTTSTNSLVQLSTEPMMRGRVLAILLAMLMGGTLIGAPIVGWVTDMFGPRMGLAVGASAGISAFLIGIMYLARYRHLRIERSTGGRLTFSVDPAE